MNWSKIKQSSVAVMTIIIVSKLIGIMRDMVLANYFGTTNISDAYIIASTVPTLLFFFIGHSLSTAYIPMYNKVKVAGGEKSAQKYSNNLLTAALIIATIIVVVLLAFPTATVKLFAIGFDEETAKIASRLIRISAPSIYLMTMINICGGYLQANKSFLAPAAISLPRNIAIIVSIALAASLGTDVLGWGLLASYVLEFLFLAPFVIKKGYIYKPYLKLKDEDLKQTLYVIAPILLGMSVSQINKIIDRSLASTFVEGGLSALTYGSFINTAISEVLVTGIITILFSKCAEYVAKGEDDKVVKQYSSTINTMLFVLIPATVGILILAEPIVSLLLSRGNFNEESLAMTSGALRFYALCLCFTAVRDVTVKIFYAYKSTKVTTITSIISISINIGLNFLLSHFMGINGLALATSIAISVQTIILYVLFKKKLKSIGTKNTIITVIKSVASAVLMGIATYFSYKALASCMYETIATILTIIISCAIYFVVALILKTEPIMNIIEKFRKKENTIGE
ncbi:MAG: murein biosynthesis integral membrane protein MurJ [Ruminococcaceae bacterium]|nr:murein biosynthesis integral membrane protein MurJ [Oscillospiraceae bacterium]